MRYARLAPERENRASRALDRLTPLRVAALMNREDRRAVLAVARVRRPIAAAADAIVAALGGGGRLFFVGARTSRPLRGLRAAGGSPAIRPPPTPVRGVMA